MDALKPILLEQDYGAEPIFAVLDGAQFDDLPMDLMMGGFVSRCLYLDRGDNDPEQVITAPHMVWLDERLENEEEGRAPEEVVEALAELVDGKPAVVFWQCSDGADALFKHLRSINMVMLPKMALPETERKFIEADEDAVLFRHTDANVMAQVMRSLNQREAVRLFGPAESILFQADDHWQNGQAYSRFDMSDDWPAPTPGMLRFSDRSMHRLSKVRETGLRKWAVIDFATQQDDAAQLEQIDAAYSRAGTYGLDSKEDIWMFIALDQEHGPDFEKKPGYEEVMEALTDLNDSPELRIEYASDACKALQEGV